MTILCGRTCAQVHAASLEDAARPYGNGTFMRMLGWCKAREQGPPPVAARLHNQHRPSLAMTMIIALTGDRTVNLKLSRMETQSLDTVNDSLQY